MRGRVPALEPDALASLERKVTQALAVPRAAEPEVLGYGEISTVLALRFGDGGVACKRLPLFPSDRDFEAYRACFEAQLEAFEAGGIPVLATGLHRVERTGPGAIAYCVQPLVEAGALVPTRLARKPGSTRLVEEVLDLALAYVAPTRGIDGQLANWAEVDGELVYLDVSTPLLRDEDGRERLDVDVFLASLPWALRGVVRRFMLHDILAPYYSRRGVVLDLLGNLVKEGLGDRLPELVPLAAGRLGEPLGIDEVRRHYVEDARMWRLLQRLRRIDRAWQWHVRRRPYPFLLPGPVERHV